MIMSQRLRYTILVADLTWITLACVVAPLMRYLGRTPPEAVQPLYFYLGSISSALIVWMLLFFKQNLDGFSRGWDLPAICSKAIIASIYLMVSMLALGFMLKIDYSRIAIVILGLLIPLGLIAVRVCAWWGVRSWSRMGDPRRVVILGSGRVAKELAHKIARHPELMIEVVGFLYPSEQSSSSVTPSPRQPGNISMGSLSVLDLLQQKRVKELILAEQLPSGSEIEKLVTSCHRAGMRVHLVPQWYELYLSKARLTEIDEVPMVTVESRRISEDARRVKRVVDLCVGVLLMIPGSILIGLIAAPMYLSKKEPFKKILRCGLNGKQFWMYRFNIDRWSPDLVGYDKFLARFSLTELPQLWNVIRGDMSLVGPRPESPERVKHYSLWQQQRLSVKPGVTGLAQVYGLREEHSSEEKAHFDLQYIYDWSLFTDLSIVLQTGWTLAFRILDGRRPHPAEPAQSVARPKFAGMREVVNADRP
jgi:lipopolysaccharide/colanic/teichoic acid biosynthesis glycosyltransferase